MEIPPSMRDELSQWNNGDGVDLESFTSCVGNFRLAVGYCTVFWPELVLIEGYMLRGGISVENLRQWEDGKRSRASVERVLNHEHIADIHAFREDTTKDKIIILGNVLKEMLTAKLKWQFPDNPCDVTFYIPEDEDDLRNYQVSFWQPRNEAITTPCNRR